MTRLHLLIVIVGLGVAGSLLTPTPVVAHGGGLDGRGCHNDRKNGGYHCHRGPLAGQSFASSGEAGRALDALRAPAPRPKPIPAERPPTNAAERVVTAEATAPTPTPSQGPPPSLRVRITTTEEGWQITNLSSGYTWQACEAEIANNSAKLPPMPPNGSVIVKRSEFKPVVPSAGARGNARDMWVTCKVGATTFTATTSQQ
jgi:hypothetical protein